MKLKLRDDVLVCDKLIRKGSVIYLYSAKQKAKEILTEEELKMIESLDGTNQFKYTAWLATQYKENGISIEDLSEILTQMKQIPIDFQNKSYDQVKKELEKISEKKEKEYTKGLVLNKDYEFIDKNENYFVFSPLSKKGSIQLGKRTSWCTSRNDRDNRFNDYDNDEIKLYYFLPKLGRNKYAIQVESKNEIIGFDVDNNSMIYNKVLDITGFDKTILKPWKLVKDVHYKLTGDSNKDEILLQLQEYGLDIRKAKINEDLTLDYKGNVVLGDYDFEKLPFRFNKVKGHFSLTGIKSLISLQGSPKEVTGGFDCIVCNSLLNLEGSPQKVGAWFNCSECLSLVNLKGAPRKVWGSFHCSDCNSLSSLKGAPTEVYNHFYCRECTSLINLEGAPRFVKNNFDCSGCISMVSLEGAPKVIKGDFNCINSGVQFNENDVMKVCDVKGEIYV